MTQQPANTTQEGLLVSMMRNAVAAIITGLLGFFISTGIGLKDDLKTVAVGASILLGVLIVTFVGRKVATFSEDYGKHYIEERTGIVEVFTNLRACTADMQSEFQRACRIRLLLQIGRRELGDGESSCFGVLAASKTQPGTSIRVLRASKNSPFLSEARARRRGNDVRRWREDVRRLENEIGLLRDSWHVKIEDREHCEPYLWRIFLFDDIAYVSGYLHQRGNDEKAVVYKLRKGQNSLFPVFDKYFEYLWRKYDPSGVPDWTDWE